MAPLINHPPSLLFALCWGPAIGSVNMSPRRPHNAFGLRGSYLDHRASAGLDSRQSTSPSCSDTASRICPLRVRVLLKLRGLPTSWIMALDPGQYISEEQMRRCSRTLQQHHAKLPKDSHPSRFQTRQGKRRGIHTTPNAARQQSLHLGPYKLSHSNSPAPCHPRRAPTSIIIHGESRFSLAFRAGRIRLCSRRPGM